jgi:hypothetical protein
MLCCRPRTRVRLAQSCRPREGGDPYAVTYQRSCGVWIPGLADARPGRQDKQSGNDSGEMERKVLRSFPSPTVRGRAENWQSRAT